MATSLDCILEKTLKECGATSAKDAIVLALHANLLSAGFQCVIIGDKDFEQANAESHAVISSATEPRLPPEWNNSQDVYALQYLHDETQQLCLVKAISLEDELLVSAVTATKPEKVSITLKISRYVCETASYASPKIYSNLLQLMSIFNRDLETKLVKMCQEAARADATPSSAGGRSLHTPLGSASLSSPNISSGMTPDPLQIVPPMRPMPRDQSLGEMGPFGYGDRDIFPPHSGGIGGGGGGMIFDPLRQGTRPGFGPRGPFPPGGGIGGGGGGMIFDPLRQGIRPGFGPRGPFPPGHPPGARFDPISPLGLPRPRPPGQDPRGTRSYGPDPDHLPPPGYDDMFS